MCDEIDIAKGVAKDLVIPYMTDHAYNKHTARDKKGALQKAAANYALNPSRTTQTLFRVSKSVLSQIQNEDTKLDATCWVIKNGNRITHEGQAKVLVKYDAGKLYHCDGLTA